MPRIISEPVYKDFDFRFIPHPATGKLKVLKNRESVQQAIKLLVLTNTMERPRRPTLGSTVRSSLFDVFDGMTEEDVRFTIEETIKLQEPRVKLLQVVVAGDHDENKMFVTIVFRPINGTEPITTTIELERIR